MASKVKIDNATLKRLKRKEERDARIVEARVPRQYFLIFCEGKRTEPNYFNGLKEILIKGIVTVEVIGAGANTTSLLEQAQNYCREKCHEFDQKWVVFDKDDFSDDKFNEAIFKANADGIEVAYSNEAFELWYLLHFEYCNTGIHRHQYIGKLSEHLGEKYHKNDPAMYKKLTTIGSEEKAIKWAKKLYDLYDHASPAAENPSTCVFKLVIELNNYLDTR
jgi:hypothetical protein